MAYDVHIVRTQNWLDAEKDPVTKPHVDALIKADRELSWSTTDYVDMKDKRSGAVVRYFAIRWNGVSCFFWLQSEILCSNPSEIQVVKMVTMAQVLRANVIGDDQERYELRKGFWGGTRLVIIQP